MDKYDVLKVTVGKSHTPYHTDGNIAYIRSHAISQVMSKTEYKKRLLQYDQPTFDFSALPIEQATMEDIDPNAMNVLKSKLNNPRANFQITDDNEQLLKNLHLIQNWKLTYASIILLGTKLATRKFLPFAEVSYWYRLSEWDAYNLDDFVWTGGYLLYYDEIWEKINNRNLRLNIPIWLALDINRMAFDEETIREAINNAIIHRDYYQWSSIFVIQYAYKVQVISPGWFPEWITISNITDESKPRNKLLADTLRICNMVDEFGNWVNKMITNQLRLWKNVPDYSESTKNKVVLTIDGSIVDIDFAKYMIKLGDEKQKSLNDKQLNILRKIKQWEKIHIDSSVTWLLDDWLIEKAWHGNYILCRKYYTDHWNKITYSEKKPISKLDIKVLLNKYLWDHAEWLTKNEIMDIELLKPFSWIKIYYLLKMYQKDWYITMEGKNRSINAKWKLIKKLPLD